MRKRHSGTVDLTPALAVKLFHKEQPRRLGLWGTLIASNLVLMALVLVLGGVVWGSTKLGIIITERYEAEQAKLTKKVEASKAQLAAQQQAYEEQVERLNTEISRMVSLHTGTPADVVELASIIESVLSSAKGKEREFLRLAMPAAIHIQVRNKIPASAFLAMAILESRYGQSQLALEANNYFGIKAFNDWKGDKIQKMTKDLGVPTLAYFRSYDSILDGFQGFADFLTKRNRYEKAFNYTSSGELFVQEVLKAGYCPDSDYLAKIKTIMSRHNLQELENILQDGEGTPYHQSWSNVNHLYSSSNKTAQTEVN